MRPISRFHHKVIFLRLIVFTEIFRRAKYSIKLILILNVAYDTLFQVDFFTWSKPIGINRFFEKEAYHNNLNL